MGRTKCDKDIKGHELLDVPLCRVSARRWFVGGQDAKDWRFQCEAGFIYSEPVNGTMPDRVPGSWARFQGGVFLADPTIVVKASQEPVNGS